ncbi:serine hydrolase domain-containing protein [Streptomyces sp. BBFR2]|uniref:serine hydrolase domain-containing protein n=1 Tax=Streptomyces sp. BBFR2 TaxID=3372854 RepID=UPI0037DA2803
MKLLADQKRSREELYGARLERDIRNYLVKYSVPGISIAIMRDGRLEYADAFGSARRPFGTSQALTESDSFRVASISKMVTAACVMRLSQEGRITLDRTVFGTNGILGTAYGTKPYTGFTTMLTVRHLLKHTSGWTDLDAVGAPLDPMFTSPGRTRAQIIGYMLDERPPMRAPGLLYEYSNFGYCLLGRVIEKVTGKTYEQYAKDAVLSKCGISRMHIGSESPAAVNSGEVEYFGEGLRNPYKLRVGLFDSHGGWVATPIDLLRMVKEIGVFSMREGVLTRGTKAQMIFGSDDAPGYGAGLELFHGPPMYVPPVTPSSPPVKIPGRVVSAGHSGWMVGTMGFLISRDDGYSFAFLANKQPERLSGESAYDGSILYVADRIIWPAIDFVSASGYKPYDLFPLYD